MTQSFNDEYKLIKKAAEGDKESLESLLLSCQGKAYSIAFRYLKNEDDAMDAVQESFIKIFRSISKFNFESRFDTWVYRIVVNTCNDIYRKNKNREKHVFSLERSDDDRNEAYEIPDDKPIPDDALQQKEEGNLILRCTELLSGDHREVIILRDVQGFSYDEIAEILGCSIGTVKSRISRARSRLREIYLAELRKYE